jgi:hypothetical protein
MNDHCQDSHALPSDLLPTVPNLPVVPPGQAAEQVMEGVLLSDLESEYVARHLEHQRAAAAQQAAVEVRPSTSVVLRSQAAPALRHAASVARRGTGRATEYVLTGVRVVATHERTRTAVRWAIRNGIVYVATGFWVVVRRVWEAHSQSRYQRMMRQAELAGDIQRLIDWEQRSERARALRHKRRMDWLAAPFALARAVAVTAVTGAATLLALGITLAVGHRDLSWVLSPLQAAVDLIAWVVWLVTGREAPAAVPGRDRGGDRAEWTGRRDQPGAGSTGRRTGRAGRRPCAGHGHGCRGLRHGRLTG